MKTTIYSAGTLFCGGCNPTFDRLALYEELKRRFCGGTLPEISFDHFDSQSSYDFILLINGCGSECLLNESFSAPVALIRGGSLDTAEQSILRCLRSI